MGPAVEAGLLDRARALLAAHPVVDGHNDLPWELRCQVGYDLDRLDIAVDQSADLHTDLPRMRAGGVGAQFWSVYVPSEFDGDTAVSSTLEQIDCVHALVERYRGDLQLARTADDMEAARAAGRIASLIGAEGGHSIACSLATLRGMYTLGVRYMTLTHNKNVPWADSATDEQKAGGLTPFGEEVVREMNRLGMLVDLSHVSAGTMRDAMRVSRAPVIFSHSSARSVCDHPRNIPDDALESLADNGGVAMVTFVPGFVRAEPSSWYEAAGAALKAKGVRRPTTPEGMAVLATFEAADPRPVVTAAMVADHLDHMREIAGPQHIGIGADFDGTTFTTAGLDDVSCYPNLIAELLSRDWSETDIAGLTWGNVVRVLREAEAVAHDLRRTEKPSIATIDQLDH